MIYRKERKQELEHHLQQWDISHFSAEELVKTPSDWDGPDLSYPPTKIVPNIKETIILADEIREEWGSPVIVYSGFRPYLYNLRIEGAESSQHQFFHALDLAPSEDGEEAYREFEDLCKEKVEEKRNDGDLVGFGRYRPESGGFVHLDCQGKRGGQASWISGEFENGE